MDEQPENALSAQLRRYEVIVGIPRAHGQSQCATEELQGDPSCTQPSGNDHAAGVAAHKTMVSGSQPALDLSSVLIGPQFEIFVNVIHTENVACHGY